MKCVVCKGTEFSVRPSDLTKPENERYSRYGDCCSLSCAMQKMDLELKNHPEKFEKVIFKGVSGEEYIVNVPKKPTSSK